MFSTFRKSCLPLIASLLCWYFRMNTVVPWFTPGCFILAPNICTLTDDNTFCLYATLYVSHSEMLLYYHFLSCYTNKHVTHQLLKTLCFRSLLQALKVACTELVNFLMIRILEWGLPFQKSFIDRLNIHDFLILQDWVRVFLYKFFNNSLTVDVVTHLKKRSKKKIFILSECR